MMIPGELRDRLGKALQVAFPSVFDLKQLLGYRLDVNIDEIASGGNLKNVIFEVLTWANAHERIEELVDAACERNPGNTTLRRAHHVLNIHLALADAFKTYDQLYDAIAERLSISSEGLTPKGWVHRGDAKEHAKAIYRLIEQVEGDGSGDLGQLLAAAQAHTPHARLQRARLLVDPKAAKAAAHSTDYQALIAQIAGIIRQHPHDSYAELSYAHFRHILQVVRGMLGPLPQHQALVDAYHILYDALQQLQEETDLHEHGHVGAYQTCFHLATENDENAVLAAFTDIGFYKQLAGDATRPTSALVFGDPGYGKTAYCRMLARSVRPQALVVRVDVDEHVIGEIAFSEDGWLRSIRRRTIEALDQELQESTPRRETLASHPQAAAVYLAARSLSGAVGPPAFGASAGTEIEQMRRYASKDLLAWLELLAQEVCRRAGYDSIYLLIDMKDHQHLNIQRMRDFFDPLLKAMLRSSETGYAIKLFLPARMRRSLAKQGTSIDIFDLDWKPAQLEKMLSRYLANRQGMNAGEARYEPKFADLCTPDVPFQPDACLAQAALESANRRYSPRRLMALAWAVVNLHLARYPSGRSMISAETIEVIVGKCRATVPIQ